MGCNIFMRQEMMSNVAQCNTHGSCRPIGRHGMTMPSKMTPFRASRQCTRAVQSASGTDEVMSQGKEASMGLILYHLETSRSQRIIFLLEELGVDYEVKLYKRVKGLAPSELKDIHPLGHSPILRDDGRVLAETGLIIEYLVDKYGPHLAPPKTDTDRTLEYKYWLYFGEGSAMPVLLMSFILGMTVKRSPWFLRFLVRLICDGIINAYPLPNIKRNAQFMEDALAKSQTGWFVGDFGGADVMLMFYVEFTENQIGLNDYPKLKDFLERVHSRPAWKSALSKGGKYN